jgi:hydroxyethylthiazole kinase-like uncharacterized protein yjeF
VKIVTASEMRRLEKLAEEQGGSSAEWMENAGRAICEAVEEYALEHLLEKEVLIAVGKGNKGGDGYVAGRHLLRLGFRVVAYPICENETCTPLSQQARERFIESGGEIVHELGSLSSGLILDALIGTGFEGKAEGVLARTIEHLNRSGLPIIAIDIPSGVNGSTGEVESVAIEAAMTITLGFPKLGLYIQNGWDHAGVIRVVPIGLSEEIEQAAAPYAHLIDPQLVDSYLPPLKRSRHKYDAGYVLGLAGSYGMSGAAHLSSYAALRSGCGLMRLFHLMGMETTGFPPEIMKLELHHAKYFLEEQKRADSCYIGPGLGQSKEIFRLLKGLVPKIEVPCVIDADGLNFLAEYPATKLPNRCVLTPHRREMERLLGREIHSDRELHAACKEFATRRGVTLVLKGSPTILFFSDALPIVVDRGDPGMATAGAGDVLTGIIASLLAQKLSPKKAATLGVTLHALAGEYAALTRSSYSMVASDIIEGLAEAFKSPFSL